MLDWIKLALGATARGSPGSEILDPLKKDLERLSKLNASFPAKALAFVLEGAGGDIPSLIRNHKGGQAYYVWTALDKDAEARQNRWQLYDHWDELPADFWVRFASVLAADARTTRLTSVLGIAQQQPWIAALAADLTEFPLTHAGGGRRVHKVHGKASMARLESLLESVGLPPSAIVVSLFQSAAKRNRWLYVSPDFITLLPGFQDSVVRDADQVRGVFRDQAFEIRAYALSLIERLDAQGLRPFAAELVALSLDSSNKVRAAATPLALRAAGAVLQIARREAVEQKPEGRARALELLWQSGDEEARAFVRERASADSADSVRKSATACMERVFAAPAASAVETGPAASVKVDLHAPLSQQACAGLHEIFRINNELIRQRREAAKDPHKKFWRELSAGGIDEIVAQTAHHPEGGKIRAVPVQLGQPLDQVLKRLMKWCESVEVSLPHVVRLMIVIQWISNDPERRPNHAVAGMAASVLSRFGRTPGRASLLALKELFGTYGVPVEAIGWDWFSRWGGRLAKGWPDDAVWPYFARNPELILEAMNPAAALRREYWFESDGLYDVLALFPEPPVQFVPQLFDLALGSSRSDRVGAQRALDRYPEKVPRIIAALESGTAEARAAAAAWLARLRARDAIEPLEAALAKEKHDVAAGAMMSALQLLGVPVDRFLNRDSLLKEARAGLKKGVPADLQWFPFEGLPGLEWNDTGEPVPEDIRRWWIVRSCKLKSPEPGGVLRQYFAALRPASREAFALYVLQAWLYEDVKPIAPSEAEKRARAQARQTVQQIKQYPQGYPDDYKAMTEEQLYETYMPTWLAHPAGSVIASKGVLGVVAAGGGSEVAPLVHRYLKQWYGMRASQGKSLIQMLAWIEHPTATQLVLSIGSRFRTKGFQEEATRQAQLLAERRNWTLDELSDRTIPTAGFDSDGTAEIDYGTRRFTAKLTADDEIELFSAEGKQISSLPDARKEEDEARVKEAKKQWSAARKELKGTLQLQRDRLYEGLCTERTWTFEDWNIYLNQHPIVRRYCQRLVWVSSGSTGAPRTFRPLDDGSLTDLDDNNVVLEPAAVVSLAHDSNVPEPVAGGWLRHLRDYKVEPLFQQFGKGTYRLPEEQRDATEVEQFKGHLIDAFALRGRATKLGYTRGAAQDGGWFMHYEKRFPTLGLEAQVQFSGSSLPEEKRLVALLALVVVRRGRPEEGEERVSLGEVPKVLLSECWNDLRIMAADGSGFDPDWPNKVKY
jgi:hypothetical protein